MPLYEYECTACAHRFERIQKYADPPVATCPSCGGVVRKLLSSPAIQFKGTGWYVTDYARKDRGGPSSTSHDHKSSEKKSDEKKSDAGATSSDSSSSSSGSSGGSTPSTSS